MYVAFIQILFQSVLLAISNEHEHKIFTELAPFMYLILFNRAVSYFNRAIVYANIVLTMNCPRSQIFVWRYAP